MNGPPLDVQVKIDIHRKLRFLLDPHPYKVIYSGRFGMKSRTCVNALLFLGTFRRLRVLCCREIMDSIKESVHAEFRSQVEELGLGAFYGVTDNEIRGVNGTLFIFAGLHGHSAESIKSYSGLDIVWVEEAQTVSKQSWDLLIPTIRKPGSEIWVTFNPGFDEDETWKLWVLDPFPGSVVVKTNWRDAAEQGWFPPSENQKRLHYQRTRPDDYDNMWEGVPKTAAVGAIYAREMAEAQNEGRLRPIPYDPRIPVHTVWDLGWNDKMVVLMVQKPVPSAVNVINYYEDNFRRYDEVVALLERLNYRWGTDWLPHDGGNANPHDGKTPQQILLQLGRRRVRVINDGRLPDPERGIEQAREMFPRVYIDNSKRQHPTGFLGAGRLIDCLRRTARTVPKTTGEPGVQRKDEYKHGADAFRYCAMVVDQMTNENERPMPRVERFRGSVRGMGALGG